MTVILLIAQRFEDFPGEYAPEVLAAQTEIDDSDAPEYLDLEEQKAREDKTIASWARVSVVIPDGPVNQLLKRTARVVGRVKKESKE